MYEAGEGGKARIMTCSGFISALEAVSESWSVRGCEVSGQ